MNVIQADIFINLIAAVSMIGLWLSIRQRQAISPVERRISYLAIALIFLVSSRALFWITNSYAIERLALIPAMAIPVLLLITAEGLMRQHAPLSMKLTTASGLIAGVFILTLGHRSLEPWFSYGVAGVQFLTIVFCLAWIILRKKNDLTLTESINANIFIVALLGVAVFSVTDFPEIIKIPARLGAVSMLFVAYVFVLASSRTFSIHRTFLEIGTIVAALGIFLWMSVSVLGTDTWQSVFQLGAVLFSLLLTCVIIVRVFGSRQEFAGQAKLRLARANTDSIHQFLEDALAPTSKITQNTSVLSGDDLSDYDINSLSKAFMETPVISDKMLYGDKGLRPAKAAREQIDSILNQYQATHIFMASKSPAIFVVSATPSFGDEGEFSAYLALVSKISNLIKKEAKS